MSEKAFRFIILTGPPGCGKTTLIKKVCRLLKEKNIILNGFFTEEVKIGRERVGFDVILLNGERSPLARVKSEDCKKPVVGKYAVEVKSFESCVLPVLDLKDPLDKSILVLDEIGKMELLSNHFEELVLKWINNNTNIILATIPIKTGKPMPLIEMIRSHPDTCLVTVDRDNRNSLVSKIENLIISAKEEYLTAQTLDLRK